ncbi:MAG: patatin-like phospholipase family protein [Odoribacter splanchnicus]
MLKVLEEAGIPIDYISGTSMGAIVGGLYAVGYNAKALDSLVRMQNWPFLLSDKVYRSTSLLPRKNPMRNTSFPFLFPRKRFFGTGRFRERTEYL